MNCNFVKYSNIENQLGKFWDLEECSSDNKIFSSKEDSCKKHFVENTKRREDGKFIVSIPFKSSINKLGDSRKEAERRLISLERKLNKQPELKEHYDSFMREYIELEHMSKVDEDREPIIFYYFPHHCIFCPEKAKSKIRVVFDGSAESGTSVSLNELQMIGPNLQSDLFSILIRFRKHKIVLIADIEKMYRQVLINPDQRSLQRILWRFKINDPIEVYELNTVTYGTAAGSFLAIRCLMAIAKECEDTHPGLAKIIREDFYVDDLITGTESKEQAVLIATQATAALAKGGFNLCKWNSNEQTVYEKITGCTKSNDNVHIFGNEQTKTLGLIWETDSDSLRYIIRELNNKKVTKRQILSEIGQIFDPLGLLGPCIILAKILLQQLWLEKLSWDESLPYPLHCQWQDYRNQLAALNNLRIPRLAIPNTANIEMHGFSDASKVAYGGCVYTKAQDDEGRISVKLLASKSRVAPLKTQTIPRLELCSAVLLVKLCQKLKVALRIEKIKVVYWIDSTIVLSWIRNQPGSLQTFVANRISQVQEMTEIKDWRHVPTKLNPADCLSRGVAPTQINTLELWWSGPDFLNKDECEWPDIPTQSQELPEIKSFHTQKEIKIVDDTIFERYGNLSRLVRVVAYCKRFVRNCRTKAARRDGSLKVLELSEATLSLVQLSQKASFQSEIESIKKKESIKKGSLKFFSPILDDSGILRVGGRLKNSNLNKNKKHPMVINANHIFARLLLRRDHIKFLHAPPNLLLSNVRESFWIVGGRNLARKIVHDCIRCRRFKPETITPMMGDLPAARVSPSYPFCNTGVDYAGPFLIKDRKGRGCKITKCYVSLFICFATKALHVELVTDATTEAFLAALRRFVSRRGKQAHVFSDNGKKFVGGNNELQRLGQFLLEESGTLCERISDSKIQWHFIPAYSPHFGGIWEAGVKSTKYHLKRVAGDAILTYEELSTLLTQIESMLNSRP